MHHGAGDAVPWKHATTQGNTNWGRTIHFRGAIIVCCRAPGVGAVGLDQWIACNDADAVRGFLIVVRGDAGD